MNMSRCRFRPVRFFGWLAGGLSIVAMLGSAASVSASDDGPGGMRSANGAPAPGVPAVASGGMWGGAGEVPGTAGDHVIGAALVGSVSCAVAGNCSAGGSYTESSDSEQAFVVNQTNGTWRKAEEIPGTAALNTGGNAETSSVSCAASGNCSAGGLYTASSQSFQAFVVNEVDGIWRKAVEVHGPASFNGVGGAGISSVSCAAAGNCSAGGGYTDSSGDSQALVVNEVNGVWGKAVEVRGIEALNTGGGAAISSVSCAAAGNCAAGGAYTASSGSEQAFVVNEVDGVWGKAVEVPGSAALNTGGGAAISSVSCAAAGNCAAGGAYTASSGSEQAFVVNEVDGVWGKAVEVPGSAALNTGGGAAISSVSCAAAGNCAAGGAYTNRSGIFQAFVVNEVDGVWRKAEEVPGAAHRLGYLLSVSCATAGNCAAGGSYNDSSGDQQAMVVKEVNGVWRKAEEVPGTAALNTGADAVTNSVSCASAGNCSAGGLYIQISYCVQAFVVNEVNGIWRKAVEVPGTAALNTCTPGKTRPESSTVSSAAEAQRK